MIDLDNASVYQEYDLSGMAQHLAKAPQLCRQAFDMAASFKLPQEYSRAKNIVILGMGGSAIGGSLAGSIAQMESGIPVMLCRDYHLPAFVDEKSLVIASSYSGNTEETLSAFDEAMRRGSMHMVITTGGKLKTLAEEKGIPLFTFDYKAPPRAALPFSVLPLLAFLQQLGCVKDKTKEVNEACTALSTLVKRMNESVPGEKNGAKQMAKWLYGKIAVVYGAGILSDVAYRWKTQINENSKAWAFAEILPELNHNSVVGYQFPRELAEKIQVIMLQSTYLDKRTQLRYRITARLLEQANICYQVAEVNGSNMLGQILGMVLLGDYISYYLAILYGTDPSPVKVIDFLKNELARE